MCHCVLLRIAQYSPPQASTSERWPKLPDDLAKAAALLQSLARNDAFVDGNKPTRSAAACSFLHINGAELGEFDVDDAEVFTNDVAINGDLDIDYIPGKLSTYGNRRSGYARPLFRH